MHRRAGINLGLEPDIAFGMLNLIERVLSEIA